MGGLSQMLQNLGAAKVGTMAVVTLALIAFFTFVTERVTAPNMALLYNGLQLEDSGSIVSQLESQNIPYELRNNGSEILVPSSEVLRLRVSLAQEGIPAGGSIGYELFDKNQSLGTTSFQQNLNRLRALEGELARTIRSIDKVSAVRVHLVLPKREVFERKRRQPTAAIILKIRGGVRLEQSQVLAIQHLVAAAVPGLKPGAISIVDSRGTLLARGLPDGDGVRSPSNLEEMRTKMEKRLQTSVEALLERSVGFGNVRVQVSAVVDFNRTTVNSETYDPDGQVVRSTQTVEESAQSSENKADNAVTVANNLPATGSETAGAGSNSVNNRTEETVNFEISKTVKSQVREAGVIRRLSVAVLVNGKTGSDANGKKTYEPRSEEELAQLATLVRSAIGYDKKRGDQVEVVNMQFATLDDIAATVADPSFLGLTKDDYFRLAEMLVLTVVGILVLLLVVRPLISRGLSIAADAVANSTQNALTATGPEALPGPNGEAIAGASSSEAVENLTAESEEDSLIDIARIEGQVKASSVKKVVELVERHPDETVAIMRNWLYKDA